HEMKLEILARRHVQDAVRVFLGAVSERLELGRSQSAKRDLDPLHPGRIPHGVRAFGQCGRWKLQMLGLDAVVALTIVVALTVGTTTQAGLGEELLVDLAKLPKLELGLVNINFISQRAREFVSQFFLPRHGSTICSKFAGTQQER